MAANKTVGIVNEIDFTDLKLTEQKIQFCFEYVIDFNASRAGIAAKYSKKTAAASASRLLKSVNVMKAIRRIIEFRLPDRELSEEYVIQNLMEIVERCMQRAPVMVRQGRQYAQMKDAEGRDVWQFNSAGANKALETLARHLGMLNDKLDVSLSDDLADRITRGRNRTDEQQKPVRH